MKHAAKKLVKTIVADRALLLACLMVIIATVIYVGYVGLAIKPRDISVVNRYTAFGDELYYRSSWYYLLNFAALAVVIAIAHVILIIKLAQRHLRPFAMGLAWLTLVIFGILAIITHSILYLVRLS